MKRYIRASGFPMCYTLFKVKASDQPIDMEDYDSAYYILSFNYYRNASYTYELVCEERWADPEVAEFAEQFDDGWIQLSSLQDKLAVELWNKELKARGIDKTITDYDLQKAVRKCWY